MLQLRVHRYQFNCQTEAPLQLNAYSGSMLRGAFGRALRQLVCVTKMDDCKACLLYRQCTYTRVFEPPVPVNTGFQKFNAIPSPFIIEPPPIGEQSLQAGETFSFNLVLIGVAIEQLAILIQAWQIALQRGLGKTHSRVALCHVIYEPEQAVAQRVYQTGNKRLSTPADWKLPNLEPTRQLTVQLLTPLRLQQKGKVLLHTMRGRDFLMALVRRYYLLAEFYADNYLAPDFSDLALQAEAVSCKAQLQWFDWQRYSSRQKQKMVFGGVIGELELSGDLTVFLPLLISGQWLHVGNKTSFGMGRYQITL